MIRHGEQIQTKNPFGESYQEDHELMQYLLRIVSFDEFDVKKVKELAGIFGEKQATRISLLKDLRVNFFLSDR